MKRTWLLAAMAFLVGAVLAVPGWLSSPFAAAQEIRKGGTLRLVLGEDPDSLDPHGTISLTASTVQSFIYDRLVYINLKGLPAGRLASGWTISPDQKTVTFKLRTGLKFHDGTPVNAQAVEFTFRRLLDPATASPARAQFKEVREVRALDDTTVRFTLDKPFAPFFTNLSLSYAGIVSPAAVQRSGREFGRRPVGSGPFKLDTWIPGSSIILARYADYQQFREDVNNKGSVHVAGIVFKIVPSVGTRIAALEAGELDMIPLTREAAARFLNDRRFQVVTVKNAQNFVFIEFNYKRAPFDNPKFRAALGWAIDKKAIVDAAWGGFATMNLNPIPVGVSGWDDKIGKQYGIGFDARRAGTLLDELGWRVNPATRVRERDGRPAKFTCWTYSGFETVKRGCEIIQANLKDVGIDIDVKLTDFGTLSAEMPKAQFDFDLMRWTWPEPNILSLLFKTPGWRELHSDPELDAILERADTTMDPARRLEVVRQAQVMILQKAIVIPILTDWAMTAATADVQGVHLDFYGAILFEDVWLRK
jgi:peptide/nickel transport system substrate-binding protein